MWEGSLLPALSSKEYNSKHNAQAGKKGIANGAGDAVRCARGCGAWAPTESPISHPSGSCAVGYTHRIHIKPFTIV